nr:hypothetical protein Iba_scaffold15005CG0020 [Ipomoea batatas]GME18900.1 hypothetical protein Iba_scaffold21539CG0410 [Ipomoea batatas]
MRDELGVGGQPVAGGGAVIESERCSPGRAASDQNGGGDGSTGHGVGLSGCGPLGIGPSEAALAQFAKEIIYEAAMGEIEQLAERVMNEDESGLCTNKEKVEVGTCAEGVMEYEDWFDKLKKEMGNDKEGIKIIEDVKQEVMSFFAKAQKEFGLVEFDKRMENLVEEANQIFLNKIAVLKGRYKGVELIFVSPKPSKAALVDPCTPNEGRIRGVDGKGNSSSVVKEVQKKKFDVEEWAIDLNKIWEEDEEMWSVMDNMFEDLKKFLETHGGIKKNFRNLP